MKYSEAKNLTDVFNTLSEQINPQRANEVVKQISKQTRTIYGSGSEWDRCMYCDDKVTAVNDDRTRTANPGRRVVTALHGKQYSDLVCDMCFNSDEFQKHLKESHPEARTEDFEL